FEIHRRPLAPLRIGSVPCRLVAPIKLLVKLIRAEMPWTSGAVSAPWTARASDCGAGLGPDPDAATAIAVPPAITATTPAIIASRRRVETVRRYFMAIDLPGD